MKFVKLHIENFMAIHSAKIELSDKGLVLVQGENVDDPSADSNGAGKSSIPDALCWCLFGVTARGVTGDAVINRGAGKNTVVRTDVQDGDDIFHIARHRKHRTGKNGLTVQRIQADGTITDLTKGTDKLTQEVVNQILGCSLDVFRAAVYSGQEAMPDLPGMTDKHLKLLVEEAAGINVLEQAYEEARKRLQSAQRDYEMALRQVGTLEQRVEDRNEALVDAQRLGIEWNHDRDADVKRFKDELREAVAKIKAAEAELAGMKEEQLREALKKAEAKIASVAGETTELHRLMKAGSEALSAVKAKERDVAKLKNDRERQEQDLANVESKVGSPCGECGKPYEEHDLDHLRDHIRQGIARLDSEINDAEKQLEVLRERSASAADALEKHEASMTDVTKVQALVKRLNEKLREIADKKTAIDRMKLQAKATLDQVKRLEAQTNPYDALIEKGKQEVEDAKRSLDEARKRLEEIGEDIKVAEAVVSVFGPAGVRAHILDTVTPFLNERTAHYLGSLSDGAITATWQTLTKNAKGELREKFSIDVTHSLGGDGFASLSGGEKRKVRLATALALQDLVASRATKPIDLWIGDEIDHALDTAGLERLMNVLEDKARERGTVLVISHNDISDWIRESIVVRKHGGKSTVSGVICGA